MRPRTRAARPSPRRRTTPKRKPKRDPSLWVFAALVVVIAFVLGWEARKAYDRAQRTVTAEPQWHYVWPNREFAPAPTDEEQRRRLSDY